MQELAKQFRYIMFTTFLFEKLSHLNQFYTTETEFIQHLMSGEVTVTIPDLIKYQQEYEKENLKLPSQLQPNQVCKLQFQKDDTPLTATVRGVHFYIGKVKYDLGLWLCDGSVDNPEYETRIYNVDSIFCSPA